VIQELRHRIDPLPTGRASWDDNASTALGHAWLFGEECGEVVAANFGPQSAQQFRLFHWRIARRNQSDVVKVRLPAHFTRTSQQLTDNIFILYSFP
jgi:hypothetical protein